MISKWKKVRGNFVFDFVFATDRFTLSEVGVAASLSCGTLLSSGINLQHDFPLLYYCTKNTPYLLALVFTLDFMWDPCSVFSNRSPPLYAGAPCSAASISTGTGVVRC